MKAILEFNLPDDQHAYELANRAQDMFLALSVISNYLREQVKHANPPDDIEKIRAMFYEIVHDNNITDL